MARNKNTPGAPDFDPSDLDQISDGDATFLGWNSDQAAPPSPQFANALVQLGLPDAPTTRPDAAAAVPSGPAPSGPAPTDVTGTSGADTFLVHTGTLAAAVATPPTIPQFSGYSAAQGDVIDFAAMRAVAFIASTPDSSLVRVTAEPNASFATFEFNFGTAEHPNWTALAKLDGVHTGDTVNVALDATHTVQLQAAWLM